MEQVVYDCRRQYQFFLMDSEISDKEKNELMKFFDLNVTVPGYYKAVIKDILKNKNLSDGFSNMFLQEKFPEFWEEVKHKRKIY